ncbi:MAG: guanylate kinase, partial [Oscillospiraceae bacterium]|nr:guanylate kinase [Oscillospiraceae bacterium]
LDIDVQGAMQIKEILPESVLVFILPPKFSDLEARIRGRSAITEAEIEKRLETARGEYGWADKYDYIVVNDTPEEAADELLTIMKAESFKASCRREYMKTDRD